MQLLDLYIIIAISYILFLAAVNVITLIRAILPQIKFGKIT